MIPIVTSLTYNQNQKRKINILDIVLYKNVFVWLKMMLECAKFDLSQVLSSLSDTVKKQ